MYNVIIYLTITEEQNRILTTMGKENMNLYREEYIYKSMHVYHTVSLKHICSLTINAGSFVKHPSLRTQWRN